MKICCIFNVGPHYRYPIYRKMAEAFDVDFYIGDKAGTPLKTFKYESLPGFRKTLQRRKLWGNWYWMSGTASLALKSYDCYVLTGEPFGLNYWILLVLARCLGKETIAWTHGWYGRETGMKKLVKKLFFRLFSKVMCYNEYSAKLMVEEGFSGERVFVLGNSLDTDTQREVRASLRLTSVFSSHFGNNNPVILYCGRIQKVKRLDRMVDMLEKIIEKGVAANMVFVGKDVENVCIGELAKAKGLSDRIWCYGACYDEQTLGELFYNAAVCVSPGNVGLTAIHALSYGCPVVTHNDFPNQMPEFEAVRPGVTGDFFDYDNLEDMTRCTLKWLELSDVQRMAVRQAAFAEIDRKWNIYAQMEVLERVLRH